MGMTKIICSNCDFFGNRDGMGYCTKHEDAYPSDSYCYEFKQKGTLLDEMVVQNPTTKNDLGVDCISRADVLKLMKDNWHTHNGDWAMQESMDDIRALPSVTPQEPFKPMVEIDLDYVIKQKYIEREVLDKIRAEINEEYRDESEHPYGQGLRRALQIIDEYKAESEET